MSKFALIPAYNEEDHVEDIVKQFNALGVKSVVVDDGSKDETYKRAKKIGAIVLRHEVNKGKGEALKTGLDYLLKNHTGLKYLVVIDADMQYDPNETIKIFRTLEQGTSDFVMGFRNWDKVPFRHRLGNFVWRTAFNIFFGTNLKDTNCGLIGFNRKAVEKLKHHIQGGYIVDNSLLIGALKNKLKISQVPVKVNYHEKSKVGRGIRVVATVLLYILKEGLKYRLRRK